MIVAHLQGCRNCLHSSWPPRRVAWECTDQLISRRIHHPFVGQMVPIRIVDAGVQQYRHTCSYRERLVRRYDRRAIRGRRGGWRGGRGRCGGWRGGRGRCGGWRGGRGRRGGWGWRSRSVWRLGMRSRSVWPLALRSESVWPSGMRSRSAIAQSAGLVWGQNSRGGVGVGVGGAQADARSAQARSM